MISYITTVFASKDESLYTQLRLSLYEKDMIKCRNILIMIISSEIIFLPIHFTNLD
jgi:hypothetical protein